MLFRISASLSPAMMNCAPALRFKYLRIFSGITTCPFDDIFVVDMLAVVRLPDKFLTCKIVMGPSIDGKRGKGSGLIMRAISRLPIANYTLGRRKNKSGAFSDYVHKNLVCPLLSLSRLRRNDLIGWKGILFTFFPGRAGSSFPIVQEKK